MLIVLVSTLSKNKVSTYRYAHGKYAGIYCTIIHVSLAYDFRGLNHDLVQFLRSYCVCRFLRKSDVSPR